MKFPAIRSGIAPMLLLMTLFSGNIYAKQNVDNGDNKNRSSSLTFLVGGFINANAGFRNQEGDFKQDRLPDAAANAGVVINDTGTRNRMTNNPDFTNEAEIHIKVANVNDFGMKYGAVLELESNASTQAKNANLSADKAYIFTESKVGKIEFGNNSAVNHKMKVGPETFARGAGGINGKYLEYVNLPILANSSRTTSPACVGSAGGFGSNGTKTPGSSACDNIKLPSFILIPQSPVAHGGYARGFYNSADATNYGDNVGDAGFGFNKNKNSSQIRDGQFGDLEDAGKINYYTPRIEGLQLGATFTPDANNSTSSLISGDNNGDIKQVISYGVNYSDNIGNVGFAISATGETGKFERISAATTQRNNLQAYDLGFMASFFGATIGASYGNWGKSLQPKTGIYSCNYDSTKTLANQTCNAGSKFNDATYYAAGLAYQFGPLATSLTYLDSNFQENQYEALSFGVDYKMVKGLMPYIEATKYKFVSNQPKASDLPNQQNFSNKERQLKDNKGYVILVGLLFSF